jgi:hypothetical protein
MTERTSGMDWLGDGDPMWQVSTRASGGQEAPQRNLRVAVVVPTLGLRSNLERLVQSVINQRCNVVEVVIVVQGQIEGVRSQTRRFQDRNVRIVQTSPGSSHARNFGIASLSEEWDVVAMLDDDLCCDESAFVEALRAFRDGADAVCSLIRTLDAQGTSRIPFGAEARDLDERSVWSNAMEAGCFFSRRFIATVGTYDERLGLGNPTPWQSGEGTDLLIRGLKRGLVVRYLPNVLIWEDPIPPMTAQVERARHRRYARGTGRVFRCQMSATEQGRLLVRSTGRVLLGLRHLSIQRTRIDLDVCLGRVEGILGRTVGSLDR